MSASRSESFHDFLNYYGIDEPSPMITPSVTKYKLKIPDTTQLIPIPDIEVCPPEDKLNQEQDSIDEIQKGYIQASMNFIAEIDKPEPASPIISFPDEFDSVEDFVLFKRQLATFYQQQSQSVYGWKAPVGVCKDPTCLNSTPPYFEYCISHIVQDPHFENQKLLHKCEHKAGCQNPCNIDDHFCCLHSHNRRKTH